MKKCQNFPTLVDYYMRVNEIMKEQIAEQFHEVTGKNFVTRELHSFQRSFGKMARLVSSTMQIVGRENIGKKEMIKKKVAQLKINLDSMYSKWVSHALLFLLLTG